MTSAQVPAAHAIEGHWRLLSFLEERQGQWLPALDAQAQGFISYWPNGRMQVLIGGSQRPRLRGAWDEVADADKAACLDGLVAYGGSYSLEEGLVRHQVEVCWIPNWQGRELVRLMSFPAPGQLLLATVPETGERARPGQRVLWEKMP